MKIIRVMIVEDDFMVAKVNAKMTEAMEGFKIVKIANSGN
jgi:response regulator of citrate/malate metabolism